MPKKEVRLQRIAKGICPECNKRKPIEGKTLCQVCLDYKSAYRKRKDDAKPTKLYDYKKEKPTIIEDNITGKQFGDLTCLEFNHKQGRTQFWLCQCKCGEVGLFTYTGLMVGLNTSCGCEGNDK